MADDVAKRQLKLELDEPLYQELVLAAQQDRQSLNAYIVAALSASVNQSTFEGRHIVGQTINGHQLDLKKGLVNLSGIYYRYLIKDRQPVVTTARYKVVENHGNVLTLEQV